MIDTTRADVVAASPCSAVLGTICTSDEVTNRQNTAAAVANKIITDQLVHGDDLGLLTLKASGTLPG